MAATTRARKRATPVRSAVLGTLSRIINVNVGIDPKPAESPPKNVGARGGNFTAPSHFAACAGRQLCHNFVAKTMRELSHVD